MKLRPADWAFVWLGASALTYELRIARRWEKELLSDGAHRAVDRNPALVRIFGILTLLHLIKLIPYRFDIYDARNYFHRAIVKVIRFLNEVD